MPRAANAVDFWRGFALVSIFINHIPGIYYGDFTYGKVSISDSADLFVFRAKSVSIHFELMFTRPLLQTADIEAQHSSRLRLNEFKDECILLFSGCTFQPLKELRP